MDDGGTEPRDDGPGGHGTGGADGVATDVTAPFLPEAWRRPAGEPAPTASDSGSGVRHRAGHHLPYRATGGAGGTDGSAGEGPSAGAPRLGPFGGFSAPDLTSTPAPDLAEERRERPPLRWVVAVVVAAVLGGAVGGGIVAATTGGGTQVTSVKEIATGPALLNGVTDIQAVIAKVLPGVVSIDATSAGTCTSALGCSLQGGGVQEEQGTGMIVSPDGEVVTNNHVIAGASSISVTLFGSLKPLPATLVDTDPTNDVALLKIENASDLPTVTLGNSDDVQVGDAVVAIGNALGLSAGTPTVTQGIISAKGRTVQASDASGTTTETLTNMFQTDAAINPGNSGGPLVSSSGKVIAMNTAVASNEQGTSQAQNIGFAIPVGKIEQLLPALRAGSIGDKGYLGVSLETLTTQLRNQYDFTPTQGAVVLQVMPGSPADQAGLKEGDVIVSFDGKPVNGADRLSAAIQAATPGTTVAIGLYRGSARLTFQIPLVPSSRSTPQG